LRPPTPAMPLPDAPHAPLAQPREVRRLRSGDTLDLAAGIVRRVVAGREYTMFGFNGQYPGPLLMVPQGGEITVRFRNELPMPTTVHWHGLRQDARMDGVPDLYQPAVEPGGRFVYTLRFPDGGIYWYHPHVREDVQQDLGLYGNIFVKPARADAYGPAHREEFLILDDLLVDDEGLLPWGRDLPTHVLNGRFGNVMLVNGETAWRASVRRGDVVRLFLTNASNTRTFNLGFGAGTRMKVVASDLGTYAREAWVESVVIAPAERYVVDVRFERAGEVAMVNRVRAIDHLYARFFDEVDTLGTVTVGTAPASPDLAAPFGTLRRSAEAAELDSLLAAHVGKPPERTLELRVTFTGLPFVSERLMQSDSAYFNPVEWAGTMPGMNWATTSAQANWRLHDPATGRDNMDVTWKFAVGERVRVRLANVREVLHGMQHPIHLHGQRFLVLAVNGEPNRNPVWKDTVLVPTGATVDVLVEFSNPGRWMVHCHIAEHLQAGMMTIFDVE
ncbi:MAG TPA: multicopper oxidase family protein, partial [Gemmatimonadales bacterium]|nr:multicopper oxidase family protein [Gemmatimonadales bacterium]